ncbi:carboxylesterase 1-like [Cicer arietinum]|uniref:Carboxylesterase 1-like n=1 Tax=Cicer arietinum TaxID=3827 RepID=A0A1S2Z8K4_CICAR|nr:carboxylesterase 1-like [Cicer arietinum]
MSKHESKKDLPLNSNPTIDSTESQPFILNNDGSVTRHMQIPNIEPTQDPNNIVISKDVPLSPINKTWLRLFLPSIALHNSKKLPLIIYYHGGGFIFFSASSTINHDFCFKLAEKINVVVASVDYRLAPESRLPAAYDDAVEALHWLKTTNEKWIRESCDVSNCYLMGSSAGGNIAYHAGLHVAAAIDGFDFDQLKIKGLILHHPFFGGSHRTESEIRLENDRALPLRGSDLMWEYALPKGVDRDHKYCNPTAVDEGDCFCFDEIKRLGWKILVTCCNGDPLIDRQVGFVEMLRSKGVKVVGYLGEGFHGMELLDPTKDEPLFEQVKDLINQC